MSDIIWHLDEAFLALVREPLLVIGVVFAILLSITIALAAHSEEGSDDA